MDLGDWLQSLGLGQYEAGFYENAVDDALLPVFTRTSLQQETMSLPPAYCLKSVARVYKERRHTKRRVRHADN